MRSLNCRLLTRTCEIKSWLRPGGGGGLAEDRGATGGGGGREDELFAEWGNHASRHEASVRKIVGFIL
jgi:hypothetical protein